VPSKGAWQQSHVYGRFTNKLCDEMEISFAIAYGKQRLQLDGNNQIVDLNSMQVDVVFAISNWTVIHAGIIASMNVIVMRILFINLLPENLGKHIPKPNKKF
jgi:hypothetical protein